MSYAYKCVAAPRRARKSKGHKSAADSFCATFETVLSEHGAAGWEYLRTDLVPMETRKGLLGGLIEAHQGVMVFRRPLAPAAQPMLDLTEQIEGEPQAPKLGAARID
jgi:hypothetical protein